MESQTQTLTQRKTHQGSQRAESQQTTVGQSWQATGSWTRVHHNGPTTANRSYIQSLQYHSVLRERPKKKTQTGSYIYARCLRFCGNFYFSKCLYFIGHTRWQDVSLAPDYWTTKSCHAICTGKRFSFLSLFCPIIKTRSKIPTNRKQQPPPPTTKERTINKMKCNPMTSSCKRHLFSYAQPCKRHAFSKIIAQWQPMWQK